MSTERKPLRRTIRGGRHYFFDDPAIDKVLAMLVTLASEVWALRERLAAMEAISVRRGTLSAGEIDGYEFSGEEEGRLAVDRKEFIEGLFRILQEHVETVTRRAKPAPAPARGERPRVSARRNSGIKKSVARKPTRRKVLARGGR